MIRIPLALLLAAAILVPPAPARADRRELTLQLDGGRTLTYQRITPDGFKPGQVAPVLLVFPPGDQSADMVNAGLRSFDPECRARGWVVISPEAPSRRELFFEGAETHIPALLDELQKFVNFEGQRVHLAGASNGGISAFRLATLHPSRVASVLAFPGYAVRDDLLRLDRLKGIPVRIWVGSDDLVEWTDAGRQTAETARAAGVDVEFELRGAQGHVISDLRGDALLDVLDKFRKPGNTLTGPDAQIARELDDFHAAAAAAEFDRYFEHFAPEGVFIGTDARERWTVEEFKAYARPHFDKGRGWTYTPRDRHIGLSPDRRFAWFDEKLDHAKYGECRGTGVLRKIGESWKLCQYHLTVPVPNEIMDRVVRQIKAEHERRQK
ncbi:MAG: nuclear transport factor 2 family protein [Phycisphaerales bacterium]